MSKEQIGVLNLSNSGEIGGTETLNAEAAGYSRHDNSYVFLFKPGKISDEMIAKGYKVEVLNTSPKRYFPDSIKIARRCKAEEYDAVVFNSSNPMGVLCAFFTKILCKKIGIILHIHSNPVDWTKKYLICSKIIGKLSDKIICISDSVLESYKKCIGYESKLVRIYNGVDLSRFRRSHSSLKSGAIVSGNGIKLIYVGRLERVKGVQNILKALAEVKDLEFHLTIVGDGNYRQELENLSVELGLSGKVDFLGIRRNIPELLWQSDIFVHIPDWEEGFGITVIEAMAAGCICVVNDHGALPEIITDKADGYIVQENKDLGRVLREISTDMISRPHKIRKIQSNAIARSKDFSIEKYARELDELINTIVIQKIVQNNG